MEDRYRLVYRGEVLDGEHRAVVKKRLAGLLKVEGERLDALFSGDVVVIRREADRETAAKFEAAFKQAGARLRVATVADADRVGQAEATPPESGWTLRPQTGNLVDATEHARAAPVAVDVSHLSIAPLAPWTSPEFRAVTPPPDTAHLSLAE
jgi:hypothetical protein